MSNGSGPKSFKQMQFPPNRNGTPAVYAPLPPAPTPRTITSNEVKRRAAQLQDMKAFINDERCPVCQAQLDGRIAYDTATVYCAEGGEQQYRAHYKYGLDKPVWSITTYYTTMFAFEIHAEYMEDELYRNTVFKVDLNLNKKFQQAEKKELFSYEGARLALKNNLTEEQILEKMKLYTLFS